MASTVSNTSKLEKPVSLIWGCELNDQKKTFVFKVSDDDKSEHQLALRTVCLGDKAKDEFHVVEIVPQAVEGSDAQPVPIATLKPSILPMATMVGIELTPPITFRLKAGSGPVYISGQHVALEEDYTWAEEEGEEEEEIEEEEEEDPESPPKAVKRPAASKKGSQAKKKMDKDDKEDESSEEDSPAKKGKGAGRGRKPAAKKCWIPFCLVHCILLSRPPSGADINVCRTVRASFLCLGCWQAGYSLHVIFTPFL
ncbi:nucleoplasmin-2 isoform X2 [Dendrobates tinctorius]|uniref:nucleoplasmin-2 isoform X2 n=2 Tax=Dendrobates tinctorius TaxID=92724 RepID=UPI003CC9CF88